jgi:Zn-dependent M16 (insulinase) family peptidase
LFGRSHQQREHFRQRILELGIEDLRRVTETYLQPERASIAIVTNQTGLDSSGDVVAELGLTVQEL